MNTSEAKRILLLYRGPVDDADPPFREALTQARRDPGLAEWLRNQRICYEAIRSKLRDVEPPRELANKIMSTRPIPFRRDLNRILQLAAAIIISAAITAVSMKLWQRKDIALVEGQEITVRGEVLDMTCYIAYHLSGPDHAECARVCIRNGAPAGIKAQNGKVYLLTGEPGQSINAELADHAAKVVTIKGKTSVETASLNFKSKKFRNSDEHHPILRPSVSFVNPADPFRIQSC